MDEGEQAGVAPHRPANRYPQHGGHMSMHAHTGACQHAWKLHSQCDALLLAAAAAAGGSSGAAVLPASCCARARRCSCHLAQWLYTRGLSSSRRKGFSGGAMRPCGRQPLSTSSVNVNAIHMPLHSLGAGGRGRRAQAIGRAARASLCFPACTAQHTGECAPRLPAGCTRPTPAAAAVSAWRSMQGTLRYAASAAKTAGSRDDQRDEEHCGHHTVAKLGLLPARRPGCGQREMVHAARLKVMHTALLPRLCTPAATPRPHLFGSLPRMGGPSAPPPPVLQ